MRLDLTKTPLMTRPAVPLACLGDICRLPAAGGAPRGASRGASTAPGPGAGMSARRPTRGYRPMQAAARARGVDLSGLRARRIAAADCDAFDMIVGMDRANPAHLRAMAPGGARAGLSPMRDHGAAQGDVPDP